MAFTQPLGVLASEITRIYTTFVCTERDSLSMVSSLIAEHAYLGDPIDLTFCVQGDTFVSPPLEPWMQFISNDGTPFLFTEDLITMPILPIDENVLFKPVPERRGGHGADEGPVQQWVDNIVYLITNGFGKDPESASKIVQLMKATSSTSHDSEGRKSPFLYIIFSPSDSQIFLFEHTPNRSRSVIYSLSGDDAVYVGMIPDKILKRFARHLK